MDGPEIWQKTILETQKGWFLCSLLETEIERSLNLKMDDPGNKRWTFLEFKSWRYSNLEVIGSWIPKRMVLIYQNERLFSPKEDGPGIIKWTVLESESLPSCCRCYFGSNEIVLWIESGWSSRLYTSNFQGGLHLSPWTVHFWLVPDELMTTNLILLLEFGSFSQTAVKLNLKIKKILDIHQCVFIKYVFWSKNG